MQICPKKHKINVNFAPLQNIYGNKVPKGSGTKMQNYLFGHTTPQFSKSYFIIGYLTLVSELYLSTTWDMGVC